MFGAPKPATGFGAFGGGGGSAFGGGNAFGQSTPAAGSSGTGTGLFGQPAATTTTGTFGAASNNVFGKTTTTPFGSTPGEFTLLNRVYPN
jgi:nuclear pore complex protein Nup98-Nup96